MPGRYDVDYDLDFSRVKKEPSTPAKPPKRIKEPWEDLLGVVQGAAPGVATLGGALGGGILGAVAGGGVGAVPGAAMGGTVGNAVGQGVSALAGGALDEQERKFQEGPMQDYQMAEIKRASKDDEDRARTMLIAQILGGF